MCPECLLYQDKTEKNKEKAGGKKKEPEVRCLKRCTGVAAFLRNLPH